MNDPTDTCPATYEMVQELHRALVADLTKRIEAGPVPADVLLVTRKVLRDSGLAGLGSEATDRERLRALYHKFVERLSEAVFAERPSAAILEQARVFLAGAGVGKDLGATTETAAALSVLADQQLPFQ